MWVPWNKKCKKPWNIRGGISCLHGDTNLSGSKCMELRLYRYHSGVQTPSSVSNCISTCSLYIFMHVYTCTHILYLATNTAEVSLRQPLCVPLQPKQPCWDPLPQWAHGFPCIPLSPHSVYSGEILPYPSTASFIISAQLWFISCLNLF